MSARPGERLNRYLARRGVASRRGADALIDSGRVAVNGRPGVVGSVVDPSRDHVVVDGRPLPSAGPPVTLLLNKPAGVVTTRRDPQGRATVMDLVEQLPGLIPVGRLDADSRGLLVLTTDGELAHRLAHPRYGIRKRYRVTLAAPARPDAVERLRRGVHLVDGPARPLEVVRRHGGRELELTLGEGRRREVRRMCEALGLAVTDLVRLAVGPLRLGSLEPGASRRLSRPEERSLRRAVGLEGDTSGDGAEYDPTRLVTVDGPAGSGKSTLGRRLAAALGLPFLDTGVFYRAVALAACREGIPQGDAGALADLAARLEIDAAASGAELYDPALTAMLAAVSAAPGVRAALLRPQRRWAENGGVAAGRDCGTVVFPDARVKLYLVAAQLLRRERRAEQARARGVELTPDMLDVEVSERDRRDASRSVSPLRCAADAHVIDTDSGGIDAMVEQALGVCVAAGLAPR